MNFRERRGRRRAFDQLFVGALALLLGACSNERTPLTGGLKFEVCPQALEQPARAFQGYRGWFFFGHDLKDDYEMMAPEQAAFVAELSRALATQGVSLIAVPVPGRAAIRPEVLHLNDLRQAAFSPDAARASYDRYLEALRREGVSVVDVLAAASAFDAAGGQAFFKRDLHWTPEGANAVAQETANIIREVLKAPLPFTPLKLTRSPHDKEHPGRFVNNWLQTSCGYALPPEPLGDYTVIEAGARAEQPGSLPEVVQAGSSFGASPFDVGFLSVALQSDVLNVSVGNGGALLALESYLAVDDYERHRPQVLVWEYPVFWSPLAATAQRRLLAGAYGRCGGEALRFEHTRAAASGVIEVAEAISNPSEHYVTLAFEDRSVLHFGVVLRHRGGRKETLKFDRPEQTAKRNEGRYFTTLSAAAGPLEEIGLELPATATGDVTVQVCQIP